MPAPRLILAVITTFPPNALVIGHINMSAFGWLFTAQQVNDLILSVCHLCRQIVQRVLQSLRNGVGIYFYVCHNTQPHSKTKHQGLRAILKLTYLLLQRHPIAIPPSQYYLKSIVPIISNLLNLWRLVKQCLRSASHHELQPIDFHLTLEEN